MVISGVFYIGLGEKFDGDKVAADPPGSVIVLPGETCHFHWAKSGEYVTQVTAIGPLGLEYVNAADDPREQRQQIPSDGRGRAAREANDHIDAEKMKLLCDRSRTVKRVNAA